MTKLAKLKDLQQAILAHNSEWKVLVDIEDIGLCRVDYLCLCKNGLVQMQYRSSAINVFQFKKVQLKLKRDLFRNNERQADFKDLYIGDEDHPDFYLDSEHNKELTHRKGDLLFNGCVVEGCNDHTFNYIVWLPDQGVTSIKSSKHQLTQNIYCYEKHEGILHRENVAYFPQFEWVTYHD